MSDYLHDSWAHLFTEIETDDGEPLIDFTGELIVKASGPYTWTFTVDPDNLPESMPEHWKRLIRGER